MADIMLKLKKVFTDTLDDIEIDINAFILNPTDGESVNSMLDVHSLDELEKHINEIPNPISTENDTDSESMDAFAGYIETVFTYLGNK